MSKYNETTIEGTSYVRADRVTINNGLESKGITFNEVELINLSNGEEMTKSFGSVSESFTADNLNTAIPLLDPETGADLGASLTYQELYVAVYSLYFKLATERDQFEADRLAEAEAAATL